jgi:hypothetical protein
MHVQVILGMCQLPRTHGQGILLRGRVCYTREEDGNWTMMCALSFLEPGPPGCPGQAAAPSQPLRADFHCGSCETLALFFLPLLASAFSFECVSFWFCCEQKFFITEEYTVFVPGV